MNYVHFLLEFKQKLLKSLIGGLFGLKNKQMKNGKEIFLIQTTMIQFNLFTSDLIFLQFQKVFLYALHNL